MFSRTLGPVKAGEQPIWEYLNYALALAGLGSSHSGAAACGNARIANISMLGTKGA